MTPIRRCVLCLMVLAAVAARATEASAQTFGATGGVSLVSVSFDGAFAENTPMKAGWLAGGFVGVGLPAGLRLRVEGLMVEERTTVAEVQRDTLRYLEVPVLVRYRLLGRDSGRPVDVSGGVAVRRLLQADEKLVSETFSIKDGVRANDLAFTVGGAVGLTSRLSLDVRYQRSLERTYRTSRNDYIGTQSAIRIQASYSIR